MNRDLKAKRPGRRRATAEESRPEPEAERPRRRVNQHAKGLTPPDQHVRAYKPGQTHVSPSGSKHVDR